MSASSHSTIQRAWLDVRCGTLGSRQYAAKMNTFLEHFNAIFATRREPQFRQLFSNGNELVNSVCKCFAANAKEVLRDGDGQTPDESRLCATLNERLVDALAVLTRHSEYPKKEIAELASTYEAVEDSNVVAVILLLHEQQLSFVLMEQDEQHHATTLDAKYLSLTEIILSCPQRGFIRRSVALAGQRSYVKLLASTALKCGMCASTTQSEQVGCGLAAVAEAAARVFELMVLHAPSYESVSDALEILETGANSYQAKAGGSTVLSTLVCYTSLLESIIAVRTRFGFQEPETVSFSTTTAQVLSAEATTMHEARGSEKSDKQLELSARVVKCLELFATAERLGTGSSPPSTPGKHQSRPSSETRSGGGGPGSFFQAVPGTFAKLQQRLTSSFGDGSERKSTASRSTIKCYGAVVSMASVFVGAKIPSTAQCFGGTLFRILRYKNVPFDIISVVLNVCLDSLQRLESDALAMVLDFIDDISRSFSVSPFIQALIEQSKDGMIASDDCRMLVLDFMLTYATGNSSNAALVLKEGLFAACVVTLSEMLLESRPSAKAYTDKVAVLSKVVVNSPMAAQALEEQNVPRLLLDAMLLAWRLKVPAVSVMLRDMFTNFVVKTGSFYGTLITAIANCSDCTPWREESSCLLATFAATLQGAKFVREAIDHNAIELCLTMVHGIGTSSTPNEDLQLLGCCLGFLMPPVCYSDVWAIYDFSTEAMERSNGNAQFIIDLCCGYFTTPDSCAACQRYFESGDATVFTSARELGGASKTSIGPFLVPERPFLQLQHPLKTLITWCLHGDHQDESISEASGMLVERDALRTVIEHLLVASETKLPNEYLHEYIQATGSVKLLCCLRDITDQKLLPYFFGGETTLEAVQRRCKAWLAVLRPEEFSPGIDVAATSGRPLEHRFNARLCETGGASGVVSCVGEQWPSPDGYSVAAWVHWESSNAAAASDRRNVIWQLTWSAANNTTYAVSLSINPAQRQVFYTCQDGSDARSITLPYIPEDEWVHVVVCHHRGKLFGSQIKVYYDGVLVQGSNCQYPSGALQTAVAVAGAGVLSPTGGTRDVVCVVGAPREKPNGSVALRFISLHVYNNALSVEDVVALFCNGAQCHAQGNWDSAGDPTQVSLTAPFLSDGALRALAVSQASEGLGGICRQGGLTMHAVPQRALIRLHARSMMLEEEPVGHIHSTRRWVILNCTNAPSTRFQVHGKFVPPQQGMANEVDALLAHGAVYEWVCWLDAMTAAYEADAAESSSHEAVVTSSEVAQDFLRVLAAANKQTELTPSTWRRLLGRLTEEATRRPGVYLHSEDSLVSLLSLSIHEMPIGVGIGVETRGPRMKHSSKTKAVLQRARNGVLYLTTLTEHVFFNWKVLSRLPSRSFDTILDAMERLLSNHNTYCEVNALRFRAADFVNGFVCGMFRQHADNNKLARGMQCVKRMLLALRQRAEFLSEILTVCSASMAADGVRLGSRLAAACPLYGALVRNLLLRAVNEVWDSLPGDGQAAFAHDLASVLPACWFTAMMAPATAHPATVVLSGRLFVICFLRCDAFRDAFRGDRILFLGEALASHARHKCVVDLVFHAWLGQVWPLQHAEARYGALSFSHESGVCTPFLEVLLHVVKRLSQHLLMPTDELRSGCGGEGQLFTISEYFAEFDRGAAHPRRPMSSLRRYALLTRCAVRLSRMGRVGALGEKGDTEPSQAVPSPHPSDTESSQVEAAIRTIIADVLDWLSNHYLGSRTLQKALYRSDVMRNTLDAMQWPAMCAIDVLSVDVAEVSDRRSADVEAELPRVSAPHSPLVQPKASNAASEVSEFDEDWEDVARDFDDDDADGDWEVLNVASPADSYSFGLDRLRPRQGCERVYESARAFYVSHAVGKVSEGDEFVHPRSRERMSKFVLALHRALSAAPRGVGSQIESCRAAFLCCAWMRAAEQSLESVASSSSPPALKNALALGDYLLSRLVGGEAVPPLALSRFFRFVLTRFDRSTEATRRSRTWLFEWFVYVTDAVYHKHDGSRAAAVVDMLSANAEILFAAPMPAGDLLRMAALRLMELTHTCLCVLERLESADGGSSETVLRKLAGVWSLFVGVNKDANALLGVLQADGMPDLWTNGFDCLMQYPSSKASDDFVGWLRTHKADLWRCFQIDSAAPFSYQLGEGRKNAKLMRKTIKIYQKHESECAKLLIDLRRGNDAAWASFLETTTFVDPVIVEHRGHTFPNSCVVTANGGGMTGSANEMHWWFLHQSGCVGLKELYAHENVDDLASEPISLYIRYPPPVCMRVRLTRSDAMSPHRSLGWNAFSVLRKITGRDSIYWTGNVYYVVGNDSRICTITITDTEVVLVSCSEFTSDGDFFIAQIRPQTARQSSGIKATFMQQAWRRLRSSAGGASGSGDHRTGTATTSKAAFRYSQYYRQLRTEALVNADALVWRFPLGHVASLHQRLFQHMPAALEFVLESGERFLVVVLDEELSFSKEARDELQIAVADLAPHVRVETMATKRARLSAATRRWVNGEVSNLDYLTIVNDAASRTVADAGQYPVLPWVLRDYKSDSIDLRTPAIYRDLTRPVGALNEAKAEQLQKRYREWISDDEPPFHYGTHYSSRAIVLYFLVRLQPFTARSIAYQGGRLDIADRLFHSLPEAWENCSGVGTGDVKELIPEFYTLSAFFRNMNNTPLGTRRDGRSVGDVVLPPWAQRSPSLFLHINALALENPLVSEHLSDWIDLVFGYKQTGEAAAAAVNVFHSLSYQEGVVEAINRALSEEDRKSIVASADNFGQTPMQLFARSPHPQRNLSTPPRQQLLIADAKSIQAVSVLPEGRISTVVRGSPFTRIVEIDHVVFGCPNNHVMPSGEPPEVFAYDSRTDSISSTLARLTRPNAMLPSVASIGCGAFSCMCASASGNFLCVGTDMGKVLLYTRNSHRAPYTTSTVLHPRGGGTEGGVEWLGLFKDGCLIVTHSDAAVITGWHVSSFSSMFAFHLTLPPCAGDSSPVLAVSLDEQRGVFYGARTRSLALFTGEGILLQQFDLSPFLDALSAKLGLAEHSEWEITAIHFCNCSSFHEENVVLLGHQNGKLTLWVVQATMYSDTQMPPEFYTVRFLHHLSCPKSVTAIHTVFSGGIIIAGLENGTFAQFSYPPPPDEDINIFLP